MFAPQCLDSIPNIVGSITSGHSLSLFSKNPEDVSGAIDHDKNLGGSNSGGSGTNYCKGFVFDASKSDATYSGTKVQINALQILACIKT